MGVQLIKGVKYQGGCKIS